MPVLPLLFGLIGVTALALTFIAVRPDTTRGSGGKVFAFLLIVPIPGLALYGGGTAHLERSKTTGFCLSCHVMGPYGRSLAVDDDEFLAAQHYQNRRVPADEACYTCHTDYGMFGTMKAKLRGLRHLMVYYAGTAPDTLRLYAPYSNRECLHCHLGSRSFEQSSAHRGEGLDAIQSGATSCLESGCHDVAHGVGDLDEATFWEPALREVGTR